MPNKNGRQSMRLQGYDYSAPGYYFVTICTKDRVRYFGDVINEKMQLSKIGMAARGFWKNIPKHQLYVKIDAYVVMPDHFHGIVVIRDHAGNRGMDAGQRGGVQPAGVQHIEPQRVDPHTKNTRAHQYQHIIPQSLGVIIRGFKSAVTKWCRERGYDFSWQRNFHEWIIRDEQMLWNVRQYIIDNPKRWHDEVHI